MGTSTGPQSQQQTNTRRTPPRRAQPPLSILGLFRYPSPNVKNKRLDAEHFLETFRPKRWTLNGDIQVRLLVVLDAVLQGHRHRHIQGRVSPPISRLAVSVGNNSLREPPISTSASDTPEVFWGYTSNFIVVNLISSLISPLRRFVSSNLKGWLYGVPYLVSR